MFKRLVQLSLAFLSLTTVYGAKIEDNIPAQFVRGTKEVLSHGIYNSTVSNNILSSREAASIWKVSDNQIFVYGGFGNDSVTTEKYLADLWSFNPTTKVWNYISGSKTGDTQPVYGTNGNPGARSKSATWKDSQGNLWLFGGEGINGSGNTGNYNDLWKYDVAASNWSLVGGAQGFSAAGIYSGVDAFPGARSGAAAWQDSGGDFWLFGGYGRDEASSSSGDLNDVWKYTVSSGKWSWEGGTKTRNNSGSYISGPYLPRARRNMVSMVDASDNVWIYGGYAFPSGGFIACNDLWKFNMSSKVWELMHGTQSGNSKGIYTGTNLRPAARYGAIGWMGSDNNVYIGYGNAVRDQDDVDIYDDIWKFNTTDNNWTWVRGSDTGAVNPVYTEPVGEPGSISACRAWSDISGDVYIFGGVAYPDGSSNNVWKLWFSDPNGPPANAVLTVSATADSTSVSVGQSSVVNFEISNTGSLVSTAGSFGITVPANFNIKKNPALTPSGAGSVSGANGNFTIALQPINAGNTVKVSLTVSPSSEGPGTIEGVLTWNSTTTHASIVITGTTGGAGGVNDLTGESSVSKVKVKTSKKGTSTQALVTITMRNSVAGEVPATLANVFVTDSTNVGDLQTTLPVTSVKMGKLKNKEGKPLKSTTKKAKLKLQGDMTGKNVFVHIDKDNIVPESDEQNNYISVGKIQ